MCVFTFSLLNFNHNLNMKCNSPNRYKSIAISFIVTDWVPAFQLEYPGSIPDRSHNLNLYFGTGCILRTCSVLCCQWRSPWHSASSYSCKLSSRVLVHRFSFSLLFPNLWAFVCKAFIEKENNWLQFPVQNSVFS